MDIVLTVNGRDLSSRLASYKMQKLVEESRMVKTLDGAEHAVQQTRDAVTFTLWPYSDATATEDYNAIKTMQFVAHYTDTFSNMEASQEMRLVTDLDAVFGLRSVDGNRYYKGGEITLRAVRVNR